MTDARVAAFAALAFSFGLVGCGNSREDKGPSGLWRLSNQGVAVRVRSPRRLALFHRATVDPRSVRLLARREGISVFIARSTNQGPCFLTAVRGGLDLTVCGQNKHPFPSAKLPAIDLSMLSAKRGDRHPRIDALVGIAADDVTRVAVQFVYGPGYEVPVIGNTYIARPVPQRPARMVVALDPRGHKLIGFPLQIPPLPK